MPEDFAAADAVARIRQFNRFYTQRIGVLDEHLVKSGYSLAEARVLYELANAPAGPQELAARLGLDPGYLSRILKGFVKARLLSRQVDGTDKRRANLTLTRKGRDTFADLDRRSAEATGKLLSGLPAGGSEALLDAMRTIETGLAAGAGPIEYRGLRTGDVGWIAHRQGLLYARDFGWDHTYEALVAKILAEFVLNFDAGRENCWIAERNGRILGSVFLVKESDSVARLRLLYVEPEARGLGLGRNLVRKCTEYARVYRYQRIVLWTQSILEAARRIYEHEGYTLVKTEPHHSFGHDLVGETWELRL